MGDFFLLKLIDYEIIMTKKETLKSLGFRDLEFRKLGMNCVATSNPI